MKIKLEDMTWQEVEEVLKGTNAVLVPVGSIEQHGLHLPLSVDSRCATYLSEEAAKKVYSEHKIRAIVAPTIQYVDVNTFRAFPGTITISPDTETRLIKEIARSFVKQGFKNIIFVNGHNSNVTPISAGLKEVSLEFPDAGLYGVTWWYLGFETIPKILKSKNSMHADELETSLSLVIQPENVHLDKRVKEVPNYSLSEKWVFPDHYGANRVFYHSRRKFPKYGINSGVMGDPTVASRETGEKIARAVIDDLAEIILEVVKSEGY